MSVGTSLPVHPASGHISVLIGGRWDINGMLELDYAAKFWLARSGNRPLKVYIGHAKIQHHWRQHNLNSCHSLLKLSPYIAGNCYLPPWWQELPLIFPRSKTTFQFWKAWRSDPEYSPMTCLSRLHQSFIGLRRPPRSARAILSWNQLTHINITYGSVREFLAFMQKLLNVVS